ncbi:MAG: hypothetical protein IT288_12140 [Bdellovibrionales bacterium]|nr:hypothetical protein [Bdellovibrionales bacterium]
MKKFLTLLVPIFLVFGFSGCTSSDIESDEAAEAKATDGSDEGMADEGGGEELVEGSEEGGGEADGGDDLAADDSSEGGDDLAVDEPESGDEGKSGESEFADSSDVGEKMTEDGFTDDGFAEEAGAESDDMLADEGDAPAESEKADTEPSIEPTPEPTSTADVEEKPSTITEEDTAASSESSETPEEPVEPKPKVSLKKIPTTPWKSGGMLLNAVYVARADDKNMKSVSQKIYGTNKSKDLLKANPSLQGRSLKVGDKIYYNSPQRPTDETQLLTYYEDNGLTPEIYTAQEGDNIRTVAQKLLGHENSWKEVWSTNADVESKGDLAAGTQLRYWAAGTVAAAPPPSADAPPADTAAPAPPPADTNVAANEPPPAPPAGEFEAPPPPPPPPATGSADLDSPPPPPPSDFDSPPPPPPPATASTETPPGETPPSGDAGAEAAANAMNELSMLVGDDPNQTMALGVGALLLLASVALFVIVRKKKRRQSLDFNTTTQTQIE